MIEKTEKLNEITCENLESAVFQKLVQISTFNRIIEQGPKMILCHKNSLFLKCRRRNVLIYITNNETKKINLNRSLN